MLTAELNQARRIGCEFEMTVPLVGSGSGRDIQNTLASVLSANGIQAVARGYSNSPVPRGKDLAVEFDSSVHGESKFRGVASFSVELKSRIIHNYDQWERIVPKALEIAKYMGV